MLNGWCSLLELARRHNDSSYDNTVIIFVTLPVHLPVVQAARDDLIVQAVHAPQGVI